MHTHKHIKKNQHLRNCTQAYFPGYKIHQIIICNKTLGHKFRENIIHSALDYKMQEKLILHFSHINVCLMA